MNTFATFFVLLFVLNANALLSNANPYQTNYRIGRFDQDVDGIDSLIDREGQMWNKWSDGVPILGKYMTDGKNCNPLMCRRYMQILIDLYVYRNFLSLGYEMPISNI